MNVQKDKNVWPSKLDFFAYVLVLGNGVNLFPKAIFSLCKYSGGLLIICLLLTSFLIVLPCIYVELFFGRYTRRTNALLYKACPLFIGLSIIIVFLNSLLLPIETVAQSKFFLKATWYATYDLGAGCPQTENDTECYDYVARGPIGDVCTYVPYGAKCAELGIVRYPNQYYYWQLNADPDSTLYREWQYMLALSATWILITMCMFVSFRQVARFLKACFLMEVTANVIVLAMALYHNGSRDSIRVLTKLKFVEVEERLEENLIAMIVYSCRKYGLIIPIGYTTISAYARFKSKFLQEAVLIVTLNIVFTLFLCFVTGAVVGVIAYHMNLDYIQILASDVGLYFTVFPEFFRFVQVPWVFNVIYILIIGLCDFGRLAVAFYLLFWNFFDLIPTVQKFHTQIVICYCTICFIYTLLFVNQFAVHYVIPYIEYEFCHTALLLLLTIKTTMIFYFYGVHRLSDDIYFMTGKKPIGFLTVMWSIMPIIILVSFFWELQIANKIFGHILDKIKDVTVGNVLKLSFDYGTWILMSFIVLISLFNLVWSKNLGMPFLASLKPDFYWGFPTRLNRMHRKNFSSTFGDRSQTTRRRKKLDKVVRVDVATESESATNIDVDECESLEGIEQFQQYFKEIFRKQKKLKRKGIIFSDKSCFNNLENASKTATQIQFLK